jgi:hypothetical protein
LIHLNNYDLIDEEDKLENCQIIKSEYPKRGELLPYYYYYKNNFFKKAVIIHDSVFIQKYIDFSDNNDIKFLWNFGPVHDDSICELNLISKLKNNDDLLKIFNGDKWSGCFGVMSTIKYDFLLKIQEKYDFFNLLNYIDKRIDRCSLERIFAFICYNENIVNDTYFGNIHKYIKWGYTYNKYINNINNYKNNKEIIKVWSGR